MKDYNIKNIVEGLKCLDKPDFINSEISKIKSILQKNNKEEIKENLIIDFNESKENSIKETELKKIRKILKNN